MTGARQPWPWWRRAVTVLSALALALSVYLGWHHLLGAAVLGCDGGSGCEKILASRWSAVGGILPVSGLAAGIYLAIIVVSGSLGPATEARVRRLAWRAMLVMVGAVAGSAVWFTIVQAWIVRAFCPYCTATHIIGLLLAALVLWQAPRQIADDSRDVAGTPERVLGLLPVMCWTAVGLVLAGLLVVCQLAFAPPAAYQRGQSQTQQPGVDPHAVPLLGSPEAPYVLELLFDYKCSHCQQLHFLLPEATRLYGGRLAFALRPTPLSRQCNPYIARDAEEFQDSCELAKIALAVWVARREAFAAFDQWMFSFESGDRWRPRTLEAARAKAIELAGSANFDTAMNAPWIGQYMQESIRTYANALQKGNGAIPKLVLGSRWVIPEAQDANDLVVILQNALGLPEH